MSSSGCGCGQQEAAHGVVSVSMGQGDFLDSKYRIAGIFRGYKLLQKDL